MYILYLIQIFKSNQFCQFQSKLFRNGILKDSEEIRNFGNFEEHFEDFSKKSPKNLTEVFGKFIPKVSEKH